MTATAPAKEWKGASWKQEEDFSELSNTVLAKVNAVTVPVLLLAGTQTVDELLDELLAVEKRARFAGDAISTQRCAVEVIKILRTLGHRSAMLHMLEMLMRKRGQMKQVQSAIIEEAAALLNDASLSRADRVELLTQLKARSEGKLHVELEHARFTMQLAELLVEDAMGKSDEEQRASKLRASDMLFTLQIETITNMPRLEKIDCVLTQIRLALDLNDANRCQVLSRKMNPRALGKEDTRERKIHYFKLMATYVERQSQLLVMARCWHEIYLTVPDLNPRTRPRGNDDDADAAVAVVPFDGTTKIEALSNCVVLAVLAGHQAPKEIEDAAECIAFSKESQQVDRAAWLKELAKNRDVENELPSLHALLASLVGVELLRVGAEPMIRDLCQIHPLLVGRPDRLLQLQERLSEHDITIVARFYRRIHLARLADLVGLPVEPVERFIMGLVTSGVLYAKIDRIEGVIVFERQANPIDAVRQWNAGVEKIATLVDRACQLVSKERMLFATMATENS